MACGGELLGTAARSRPWRYGGARDHGGLIGLLTLGMGVEHRLAGWLLLRAAAGFASAWVLIAVSAWCLEQLTPLRRPVLTGTVFAGVGVGIAAAGGLCLVAMHSGASSAQAWAGFGVLSLVATALIWPVVGRAADTSPRKPPRLTGPRHSWDRESVRLVCCYGAFGFGSIIPATFLPLMAHRAIPDPSVFGWAWPIFGTAAAFSTLLAVALARRLGNRRLWMLASLVMAVGVGLPVIRPGIGAIVVAGLLVGGTFMVNTMVGLQEARQAAGSDASGLIAAMTAAFGIGQIAGPICVSYAAEVDGGFPLALLVASLLLVASAIVLAQPSSAAPCPRTPPA